MRCAKRTLALIYALTCAAPAAWCSGDVVDYADTATIAGGSFYVGQGIRGGDLWAEQFESASASYFAQATLLRADDIDTNFAGLNLGIRASIPRRLSPFFGLGLYAGIKTANARIETVNGGLQSDIEIVFDGVAFFPEAGLRLGLTREMGILASARYFSDLDNAMIGAWVYGLAFYVVRFGF